MSREPEVESPPPVTEAELATLALDVAFDLPADIPPQGYHFGTIVDGQLLCCGEAGVFAFDLGNGTLLRRISAVPTSRFWLTDDGGYILQMSARAAPAGQRFVQLPAGDAPANIVAIAGRVKSFSDDSSEVAIFYRGELAIRRWPSLDLVCAVAGHHPTLDWEYRRLFVTDGRRHVIQPFGDDRQPRYLDYEAGEPQALYPFYRDIVRLNDGATLLALDAGWRTELFDRRLSDDSLDLELAREGRGLRAIIAGQLQRCQLDFDTGALTSPFVIPPGGSLAPNDGLWHWDVDAAVIDEPGQQVLRNLEGRTLARFPAEAQVNAWIDDGRALYLTYPTDAAARLRVEVWRCR